jgi:uncharacterized ion transporter superfamily protein YfcC
MRGKEGIEIMLKKMKIPHTYFLLFILIMIVALGTYIIPAGEFAREVDEATGRTVVVPGTYARVDPTPVSFFQAIQSIPEGMNQAAQIIFFVFIISGAFGIIQATGTISAGIASTVKNFGDRWKLLIPILIFIFSLAGAILGTAEEALPFYPIVISLCLALGFDSITGTAIVLLGTGAGFAGAFMNPFTIGIAQGVSGLPLFSGIGLRLVCYVVMVGVTIMYILRYASKIKKAPESSLMYYADQNSDHALNHEEMPEFTGRHKIILGILVIGLAILVFGVVKLGFYINELATMFLIIGILSGVVAGFSGGKIAEEFIKGAKELVYGALVIGLARAILVVMTEGQIVDSVIYGLASLVESMPPVISGVGMFFVQTAINILIPSGSGQAAATMPIMAPLADVVGVTRQTAVLAFQFGDGITNVISPTSGYFMAALAIGKIPWDKWVRFFFPLFLVWNLIAVLMVAVSVIINYGPF